MKVIFLAINAKYIHTNPAVRLLHRLVDPIVTSQYFEFTIKESPESIAALIIKEQPDVVGCSCYLWNIEIMMKVISLVRKSNSHIVWLGGGPEVGYEPAPFLHSQGFDYIVGGDGECSIVPLLSALKNETPVLLPGVATRNNPNLIPQYVNDLSSLPSIIDCYTEDDCKHRILYLETSRGCPFSCSYCLSSVDTERVRFLPLSTVFHELSALSEKGAKQIKFLDRTFNVNETRFIEILRFLETLPTKQIFQFEISADLLKEKAMNYLLHEAPYHRIRLEIGIQSTNVQSNQAVSRNSNIPELLNKVRELNRGGRVITHVDLIAGLPWETYVRFQQSFNEVFLLLSDELQLGFLKMLRGTLLRLQAKQFGYRFDEHPPYEISESNFMQKDEIVRIKRCEEGLEAYWNKPRAQSLISHMVEQGLMNDPFAFFYEVGMELHRQHPNQEWEYYLLLWNLLKKKDGTFLALLKYDYLRRNPIRPIRFWGKESVKPSIVMDSLVKNELFQVKELRNAFITSNEDDIFIILYQPTPQLYAVQGVQKWVPDKKWRYSCD